MCPTSTSSKQRPVAFYDGRHYDMRASIGHQLYHLMTQLKREVELRMAEHGLTDAQWKPLWLLKQGHAGTAFELARAVEVDAGAMTRMVDRLAAKGLIARVRSETDRRVVHLELTPDGEAAVTEIPQVLASVNNDYLRGFTRDEWKQMMNFIERMRANGQALQEEEAA
jgi:DNA-binding MarR family transcriptional regulator